MIASLTEMLELSNFGQITEFTIEFESCNKILLLTSWTKTMTPQLFFQKNLILRRLRVAIFAGIIKIVTLFIKTTHKDSRKIKRIRNYVSKWRLYLYFLITNIWQFLVKNSDVSRTQGMCHVIQIDFGSSLSKILLCLPGFIIIRYV